MIWNPRRRQHNLIQCCNRDIIMVSGLKRRHWLKIMKHLWQCVAKGSAMLSQTKLSADVGKDNIIPTSLSTSSTRRIPFEQITYDQQGSSKAKGSDTSSTSESSELPSVARLPFQSKWESMCFQLPETKGHSLLVPSPSDCILPDNSPFSQVTHFNYARIPTIMYRLYDTKKWNQNCMSTSRSKTWSWCDKRSYTWQHHLLGKGYELQWLQPKVLPMLKCSVRVCQVDDAPVHARRRGPSGWDYFPGSPPTMIWS